MSTTMVPLLVTCAVVVAADEPEDDPADVAAADPPAADPLAAEAAALDALDVPALLAAVLLLLLQAATLTTKDAAKQPAVHLRMRI